MKAYYVAKNYAGKTKSGEINVKDEKDLAEQLRGEGYAIVSFKELDKDKTDGMKVKFFDRFVKISLKDRMMFARNLGVMVSSGLPLSKAIQNITVQTQDKNFKKILNDIQEGIQKGTPLSEGLAKYPATFNELFTNMIRVGEASGNLEEVLNTLADQLERDHELVSKVKGALMYPAVIVVAMIGIGIVMMTYVVPQITSVFKDMEVELPPTTQFIIGLSDLFRNHPKLLALGLVIVVIILKFLLGTQKGKKILGVITIKTPFIKKIIIKVNCARFCRIYSSLSRSGVTVVETLNIISRTLTNYYYKKALKKAAEDIQKGINLSKIIYEEKDIFPILVPQMIEVGEETGKTESILLKLAEFYESEVNQLTKNLSSIIEPVLMIVIGGAVGFFAISVLQPMYSVLDTIN